MFEPTKNEPPSNISERESCAKPDCFNGEYIYGGYIVRETFDPDGPQFSDCIVRLFA